MSLFDDNPFYVLGLAPGATLAEAERAGQRLLGTIELGLASAETYATPLGPRPQSADRVRRALADLRDPARRVVAEALASLPASGEHAREAPLPAWPEAREALGWREPWFRSRR